MFDFEFVALCSDADSSKYKFLCKYWLEIEDQSSSVMESPHYASEDGRDLTTYGKSFENSKNIEWKLAISKKLKNCYVDFRSMWSKIWNNNSC